MMQWVFCNLRIEYLAGSQPLTTKQKVICTQPMMGKVLIHEASNTAGSNSAESESLATTDNSDSGTTAPGTSFLPSPRSSISIDTRSGKSTESPWDLQKFDRINMQRLRKSFSNDGLERYVWARDDKDALNHVPRSVYFSEEVSCWWSDEANGG